MPKPSPFSSPQYNDHFLGKLTGPLSLVQYGDFQCPSCGELYPVLKTLSQSFGNQLTLIYRHFPISAQHPLALDAAIACEAAAVEGKFWLMHDAIFENQRYLVRSSFNWIAKEAGLNFFAFNDPKQYGRLMQKVLGQYATAIRNGISSTPTLFINNCCYDGSYDFEHLYQYCLLLLAAKDVGAAREEKNVDISLIASISRMFRFQA
jgi:protein-disulfide isomerase